VIGFEAKIADLVATAIFTFVRYSLVRAKYVISDQHSNDNRYLGDFDGLSVLPSEKYGQSNDLAQRPL
jgi:hypothetical protein